MSSFICSEKVKRLQPYPPVSFSLSLTVLFPAGSSSQVFMIARHGNRSILKKQILFHRRYTDGWVFTGTFYSHKNEACDSTIGRSENKTKDIKKREMKGGEWFCLFVYLFQDLKNRVWGWVGWEFTENSCIFVSGCSCHHLMMFLYQLSLKQPLWVLNLNTA